MLPPVIEALSLPVNADHYPPDMRDDIDEACVPDRLAGQNERMASTSHAQSSPGSKRSDPGTRRPGNDR